VATHRRNARRDVVTIFEPWQHRNGVRETAIFAKLFRLIWVVQPCGKYSACAVGQINSTYSGVPRSSGGAFRGRHGRWARDAMDVAMSRDE
jgi:hypothetical protein